MKIVITGGHITPAIAFIEYSQKNHKNDELYLFGRTYSQSNRQQLAVEKQFANELNIPFIAIEVPKYVSLLPWHIFAFGASYFTSWVKAWKNLLQIKPTVLLSFGGYYAVPIVIAAWILRIPIVTHEQTTTAGRANKFISLFAKKVAISFQSSAEAFPAKKTIVTGNPIRAALTNPKPSKPAWFTYKTTAPIIYITGGNQGSHLINTVVKNILRQLTKDYIVIHACGRATANADYLRELQQIARTLPSTHHERYFVREWVTTEELAWILKNAHIAVSRAGANTIQEFLHTCLPALLIPLPFSFQNEQALNAKIMTDSGGAVTILQKDFTPEVALKTIKDMVSKNKSLRRKLELIALPTDASEKLYAVVKSATKKKK